MLRPLLVGVATVVLVVSGCAAPPPPPPPPAPVALNAPLPPPPPLPPAYTAPSYTQSYGGPRVGPSMRYGKKKRYVSSNCKVVKKKVLKTSSSGKAVYRVTKYRVCN